MRNQLSEILTDHIPTKDLEGVVDQILDALDTPQKETKMVKFATPTVTLLGHTTLAVEADQHDWDSAATVDRPLALEETLDRFMEQDPTSTHGESLVEFAGRACYQSFHKPNPATRSNRDYITRTVFEQGHGSISEHAVATLYLTGVSRACTHEIVRHRHLSPSQLSQRFVDEGDARFVIPPALRDNDEAVAVLREQLHDTLATYSELVDTLKSSGLSRKQIREAARAVLPNCTETRIVLTGNMRAWRHFIELRTADGADAEIQEVARLVQKQLHKICPTLIPIS